jgi:ABC-2 type transport system ATP-binding protein
MLKIQHVSKSFGDLKALDDVSFEVERGEIFGVIGQNGAGKSTLFRCMMDFYDYYQGDIIYESRPLKKLKLEKIGFLPEERALSPKKTVKDEIKYFAKLNKMRNIDDKTIEAYFNKFEIKGSLTDKIKDLSKGNQQKLQLLCALIYKPEFVILDEPFSGLDPYNIRLLIDIIKEINQEGTTILFSSHNMENVEFLCQNLVMLKKGKVVLKGSPRQIRNSYERKKLVVETKNDLSFVLDADIEKYERDGDFHTFYLNDEKKGEEIFKLISENLGYVSYFAQLPPSLNEIFSRKVEEDD